MLRNSPQYLFLASGAKNGEGFWIVGVKNCDENIFEDENLLDCHRKELVGNKSARDILFAINLNISNLSNELRNKNYLIERPSMGISFDIPLDLLEKIFDFWLDIYKNENNWKICLGLLKVRKRISLTNLIKSQSLKGNSKKWAIKVENLHTYVPNSQRIKKLNNPMWK
ncbi:josephin [Prochlorococcus marinus str. MU1402]|uniref:josephin n=1 Tax=Prochlorococcus marinus TaxID=1219 RepID=UPI001ADB29A8|nr:josephin [Prochlorococcus marinus]MBO8232064.1 josephin [Prochlorococcus marinus XMU1402]MBW3056801.1 josephin [Prochlorococcus marinus str. MU1402]